MAKTFTLLSALLVVMSIAVMPATPSAVQDSEPEAPPTTAPPATAPPTTAPPTTAPPTTAPPTTAPPTTAPPTTAPPTTAPPTTAPPTTAPPTTAPPTTAPPTTAPPTTAPPTTAPPTTAPPTTAPPTTVPPTTAPPTTAPPTTAPPTTAPPTTAPPTTAPPTTAPPTTATTLISSTTTTESPDPCVSNPCGQGSTCEGRANNTFVCLCLPGDSYSSVTQTCQTAKVYPGKLGLTAITYNEDMKNKKSEAFGKASDKIISAMDEIFKVGYTGATVLELRELKTPSRAKSGVEASVDIFFQANANINQEQVKDTIEKPSCKDCVLIASTFTPENLCNSKPCDQQTTECTPEDGFFICSCAAGYIPTDFSNRICLECPSGTKYINSECVKCPFGYTGFDCKDNWLLVLVIVGSVLGGLLLITLILLPVMAMKMKKKGPKSKNEDIGKPYVSHSIAKAPRADSSVHNGYSSSYQESNNTGVANGGAPRIPRATSNWESNTNLEMTPSNSRQNLISSGRNTQLYDDQDDMFTFDQPRLQSNPYGQSQGQRNVYAQVRETNPYARSQASSNPYAM
nr:mucin-13b isoform X1 [Nothobranchius furzeri]